MGFIKAGRPPPDMAMETALRRGIDHADHRSRIVNAEDMAAADLVFVFDRFNTARLRRQRFRKQGQVVWLGDLDPQWAGKRAIIDPWGRDPEFFSETFERIDRCLHELVTALATVTPAPTQPSP